MNDALAKADEGTPITPDVDLDSALARELQKILENRMWYYLYDFGLADFRNVLFCGKWPLYEVSWFGGDTDTLLIPLLASALSDVRYDSIAKALLAKHDDWVETVRKEVAQRSPSSAAV